MSVASFDTTLGQPIDVAERTAKAALAAEGFGVLSDIDVAATLRSRLGVERRPLKILGACNPPLAHRALQIDPSVALVLPCNVVLEEITPGRTAVRIADPRAWIVGDGLDDVADEAAKRLAAVVSRLQDPSGLSSST